MDTHKQTQGRNEVDEAQAGAQLAGAHLSDEQFTGLLLGTISPAVGAHLKVCAQCAEEAERVSGAIASFEQESRAWAERRAASRPSLGQDRQPVFAWLQLAGRSQAWTAAALAIVLAVGIGAGVRTGIGTGNRTGTGVSHQEDRAAAAAPAAVPQVAKAKAAAVVTPASLKADNELLSAIDGELSAEAAPSASAYGLTVSIHPAGSRAAKRISN